MSERRHPDGLPIEATPFCDKRDYDCYAVGDTHVKLERRARTAETRVAELELDATVKERMIDGYDEDLKECKARMAEIERTVAWLRSGGFNRFNQTAEGIRPESVVAHLASSPPEGWTSPATK